MANIHWITKDTIFTYLAKIEPQGWGLHDEPTIDQWHLIYHGYQTKFDVFMNITEEWCYFQIPLLKPGELTNDICRTALYKYLLHLNHEMHLLKFSLDDVSLIWLSAEILAESFDFTMFRNTTKAIAIYLDRYSGEVSIIAHQPEFANFITHGIFSPEQSEIKINIQ